MSAVNETLIRDVVAEVLGRLGQAAPPQSASGSRPTTPSPAPSNTCGCKDNKPSGGSVRAAGGNYGVFQDANEACAAAHDGYLQLRKQGVAARAKVVEIVKSMAEANAAEWGRIECAKICSKGGDHPRTESGRY